MEAAIPEINVGDIKITPVVTSRFRLDGGSMFGVVPRELWERKAPADEHNRILLHVNSLLVQNAGLTMLVETGMGSKYDPRQAELYALEGEDIEAAIARHGYAPEDFAVVVLTHLHLDHAGGSTVLNEQGEAAPTFPRARYVLQQDEWKAATDPHPMSRPSYISDDFRPVRATGQFDMVDGETQVAPGVWVERTGGHTPGHQMVRFVSKGEEALYLGDLVPTVAHLKLNWIMAWDLEPEALYDCKARVLADAARRGVLLCWSHDPAVAAARIEQVAPGSYRIVEGTVVPAAGPGEG